MATVATGMDLSVEAMNRRDERLAELERRVQGLEKMQVPATPEPQHVKALDPQFKAAIDIGYALGYKVGRMEIEAETLK